MKILVFGGTVFLGRAIARAAMAAGHDVTCAARGQSGSVPDGALLVPVDRSDPDGLSNLDGTFDAVIDVGRWPSHIRNSLTALQGRTGHWTFVSSCNVYSDDSIPNALASQLPLHDPLPPDGEEIDANYGPAKVACEQLIEASGIPAFLCRAGLIIGPEDATNRFTYWVSRFNRGGEILAPGTPDDSVQWIDVRDIASWIVRSAETGLSGAYDAIGTPTTRSAFYEAVAAGTGVTPHLTWIPQDFLTSQGVQPWMGDRSLPMWLPLPEYAGFMAHDVTPSYEAGMTTRPLSETTSATNAWLATNPAVKHRSGLTADEEAEVLAAWSWRVEA